MLWNNQSGSTPARSPSAQMGCPVNIISSATLRGTARPTATPGVVQNNPTWTLQEDIRGKDQSLVITGYHWLLPSISFSHWQSPTHADTASLEGTARTMRKTQRFLKKMSKVQWTNNCYLLWGTCWIASSGDGWTTHAIILTDSMSLLQKVEWEAWTGMCQWLTPTFEHSCGCTALDKPEWRDFS